MRKNSIKNTRINGEVQRELSRIISREIKDPRIAPMTSVVDAVVTSDLKQCKAYISVLDDRKLFCMRLRYLHTISLHVPFLIWMSEAYRKGYPVQL